MRSAAVAAFLAWNGVAAPAAGLQAVSADPVPSAVPSARPARKMIVDPRYPFTLELALHSEVPVNASQTLFPGETPPPAGFFSSGSSGLRAGFFAPIGERFQAGGAIQTTWRLRTATDWLNTTSLLGGVRLLGMDDRLRTFVDVQALIDVGSAFAIGARAAASLGYEFAPGWFVQGTLSGTLALIRVRAALGLSAGVSYAW